MRAALALAIIGSGGCGDRVAAGDGGSDAVDARAGEGRLCSTHCDCDQQSFCYRGRCLADPNTPIYCAEKAGCPPGRWAVNATGERTVCPEDARYRCRSACDCGPAHCCKAGVCIKDKHDPWRPGGEAVSGGACEEGVDATYCCSAPECHSGRRAFGFNATALFRCHDRDEGGARARCGAKSCFGTACNCAAGESCVDTVSGAPPGRTCLLLSGGSCVSNPVAESLFGFKASDLLPCCSAGCKKGERCEVGWRNDPRYAYARVVGTCGACGDGVCGDGEFPSSCPADCRCGDGRCAPEEVGRCSADCSTCGDGTCDPWESLAAKFSPGACPADCARCGDGVCFGETAASCPADCGGPRCADPVIAPGTYRVCGDGVCQSSGCGDPETCKTCPQDCGACDAAWKVVRSAPAWSGRALHALWGSSADNVIGVGADHAIVRYDGAKWSAMFAGLPQLVGLSSGGVLHDVWGRAASDVWAVGDGGLVVHFDGARWRTVDAGTSATLRAVWGDGSTLVAVGSSATKLGARAEIVRYDGSVWRSELSVDQLELRDVWGSAPDDLWAVGLSCPSIKGCVAAEPRHFDGKSWRAVPLPSGVVASSAVWGSAADDVWAGARSAASIAHYDGSSWRAVPLPQTASVNAIWGSSSKSVWAVGDAGVVLHWDGTIWSAETLASKATLYAVWGSAGEVLVADSSGTIWRRVNGAFEPQLIGRRFDLFDVSGDDGGAGQVVAVGHFGSKGTPSEHVVARYAAGGLTVLRPGTRGELLAVQHLSSGALLVGGAELATAGQAEQAAIYRLQGTTWKRSYSGADGRIAGLWRAGDADVHAVGSEQGSAVALRFDGARWTPTRSAANEVLGALWGDGAGVVYAGGSALAGKLASALLLRFDGATWSAVGPPAGATRINALSGAAAALFATGIAGVARFDARRDAGAWSDIDAPLASGSNDIWARSASDVYVVGAHGIARYDGSAWRAVKLDLRQATSSDYSCATLRAVWGTASGEITVVGDDETLLRRAAP